MDTYLRRKRDAVSIARARRLEQIGKRRPAPGAPAPAGDVADVASPPPPPTPPIEPDREFESLMVV
jgi:hypothetical protein